MTTKKKQDEAMITYKYKILSEPSIDFICPVCANILSCPQLANCCKKHICESCIEQVKRGKDPCPVCRNKKFPVKSDTHFNKLLESQEILCTISTSCRWVGTIGNLGDHLLQEHASLSIDGIQPQSYENLGVCCPYKEIGCRVEFGVDLQKHLIENIDQHMEMTKRQVREVVEREKQVERDREEIKRMTDIVIHKDIVIQEKEMEYQSMRRRIEELEILMEAKNYEIINLSEIIEELKRDKSIQKLLPGPAATEEYEYVRASKQFNINTQKFVMTNVDQYCWSTNGKLTWNSEPFYTHEEGYKMFFMVDTVLKSLRLSLYILPGKFDDMLKWPLRGRLTISLLNQLGNFNHYTYVFVYDDNTPDEVGNCVIVTESHCKSKKNVSSTRKISLDNLPHSVSRNTTFLKNNTLHFSISYIDLFL